MDAKGSVEGDSRREIEKIVEGDGGGLAKGGSGKGSWKVDTLLALLTSPPSSHPALHHTAAQ